MLAKQTNYTNLRQNLASILDEAIADRSVIIVTRQGKEEVAILAAEELNNILETLHLFRSPANAQKLIAAMERADKLEKKTEVKSESLIELCQDLGLDEGLAKDAAVNNQENLKDDAASKRHH
ncbi:MAG: type II toxin-antitoxin system prevent-host-death family antitoxin [Cyanobacteria bacterium J06621_8]